MGSVREIGSAPSVRRRKSTTLEVELDLRAEPIAPREARHWVMRTIAAAGIRGSSNQVIELLTGEVVTNAVIHGPAGQPIRVRVQIEDDEVGVEVTDTGPGRPRVQRAEPTAPNGRGIALVDVLADAWGVRDDPPGKTVWFRLDTAE